MLKSLVQSLVLPRKPSLERRYRTEYGPYLYKNPVNTAESFYELLAKRAGTYVPKEAKALDVGCGIGRFTIDLANNNSVAGVIGLDSDPALVFEAEAIAHAHRKNILSYPCQGKITFMKGDALALPFADNSFSFVSAINLIDRVYDPKKCAAELYRVVENGGILFLVDPYDWDNSLTPKSKQVENMKELLKGLSFSILYEEDNIPYHIFVNNRFTLAYKNHLLILQKI